MLTNTLLILVVVGLCTLHLAGGFWAGLATGSRRLKRHKNMRSTLPKMDGHIDDLSSMILLIQRLSETAASEQTPLSPGVVAALERIETLAGRLKGNLLESGSVTHFQHNTSRKQKIELQSTLGRDMLTGSADESTCPPADYPQLGKASKSNRFTFTHEQYMAPCPPGGLPSLAAFQKVQCWELSADGIAYFTYDPPDYERLVISLGKHPMLKFMEAEVLDYQQRLHNSRHCYLVECRFLRRFEEQEYHWNTKNGRVESESDAMTR